MLFLKKDKTCTYITFQNQSPSFITSLLKDDSMITNYRPGSELCKLNGNTNHIIVYHYTVFTMSTISTSQWNYKCLKAVNHALNAAHHSLSIQFFAFYQLQWQEREKVKSTLCMNRNIQQPINIFNYAGKKVSGYKNNVA